MRKRPHVSDLVGDVMYFKLAVAGTLWNGQIARGSRCL